MKYLSICTLALALLFLACKPDAPADTQASAQTATTANTTTAANSNTTDFAANNNGNVATPVLPDVNDKTTSLLLRTFWVAERWVNHADNSQNKINEGRWWRFKDDGTFLMGQWEQTLTHGVWVIYKDSGKEFLHLDAADDNLNMEFELQQAALTGDYMSWVGTPSYGMSRIAVKAISLLTVPTKKQFGIE